jgi:hypothetical protein
MQRKAEHKSRKDRRLPKQEMRILQGQIAPLKANQSCMPRSIELMPQVNVSAANLPLDLAREMSISEVRAKQEKLTS